jgi:hypothetical protein
MSEAVTSERCSRCRANVDGICIHPRAGGDATAERCASCVHYVGPMRGIGDVVHRVAESTGVAAVVHAVAPNCGCSERRAALNRAVPFADPPR